MIREDFIERLVRQLAELLARVLKLARAGQTDEARLAVREAAGALFGIELDALLKLDAATAAQLLGDWRKTLALAEVLHALSEVEAQAGDAALSRDRLAHALALTAQVDRAEARALENGWLSPKPG
ncbi:MAG: hypothetical protein U0228_02455 [Myxococcaceae bacterium]